jgi:hypothetical protein
MVHLRIRRHYAEDIVHCQLRSLWLLLRGAKFECAGGSGYQYGTAKVGVYSILHECMICTGYL